MKVTTEKNPDLDLNFTNQDIPVLVLSMFRETSIKITLDYCSDIVRRPAELRYTAEVESTDVPPKHRDEIDPTKDNYKVVETYQDLYSDDQRFLRFLMSNFESLDDHWTESLETFDIVPTEEVTPVKKVKTTSGIRQGCRQREGLPVRQSTTL